MVLELKTTAHVVTLLESGGGSLYFGEAVTQLEHALQTAALAERSGAPDALVVAVFTSLVAVLVTVIFTFGITAPPGSDTVPRMSAVLT